MQALQVGLSCQEQAQQESTQAGANREKCRRKRAGGGRNSGSGMQRRSSAGKRKADATRGMQEIRASGRRVEVCR